MTADAGLVVAPTPKSRSFAWTIADRLFWVALVFGGIWYWDSLRGGHDVPQPSVDAAFVKIGQEYPRRLGVAYAGAWTDGASALEGGKSVKDSLEVVKKSWTDGRTKVFEEVITPAMAKIVAEIQSDLSTAERTALVRAWRGLAKGMVK